MGLLRNLLLTIDYARGRLEASHGSLSGPVGGQTVRVFQEGSGLVRLPVTIGDRTVRLDLDTGNGRSALSLPTDAVASLQTLGPARSIGTARTVSQELTLFGVDLAVAVRVGRTTLDAPTLSYPSPASPGNIGSPAFRGMILNLDLRHVLARVVPSSPKPS